MYNHSDGGSNAPSGPTLPVATSGSLADQTLAEVSERLQAHGSSLEGDGREAIKALLVALEDGLTGSLPKAYYLSAIDPGVGKTLSVATFLRTWKAQGFKPSSSVLIGVSRLEEIGAYLKAAELDQDDVAILTSDQELNGRGVPVADHRNAPVMFTTQQMIERRTRGQSFADTAEFHFKGVPRRLRVWDETLMLSQNLVIKSDAIGSLPGVLNDKWRTLSMVVRSFLTTVWDAAHGDQITVPAELVELPTLPGRRDAVATTLSDLSRLAGRQATAILSSAGDIHLAGSSPPLPDDFAPVVILDASGRVRSTYEVWEREVGTLRRLPAAANDYDRLRVNLWERPVGQSSFRLPGTMSEVVDAVAEAINDDDRQEDWLIVSYKAHPVKDALCDAVSEEARPRLHFLTWGNHHGTNAFKHCRKVVLVGHLNYGPAGYVALASAAGLPPAVGAQGAERELKGGEYRHGYLQALTRASVRHSRNGEAAVCTAYVIASPNIGAKELLSQTFPGCTIEPWDPSLADTKTQAGRLIELLQQAARDRLVSIRKRELAAALGVKSPNLSALLQHPKVASYVERKGLKIAHYEISGWTRFKPLEGDGFKIEDLDTQ